MKRFLTTTALALSLAVPAVAETHGDASNAQQMDASAQMETMGIKASNLIDKRIFMPRDQAAGTQNAKSGSDNAQQTDRSAMAENEMSQDDKDQNEMSQNDGMIENTDRSEVASNQMNDGDMTNTGGMANMRDNWEMVGEIDDVLITEDGDVRALIVDAGGFLGMGETERRIDIDKVRFVSDNQNQNNFYVVFKGDRSQFEEQGTFDRAEAQDQGEMRATQTADYVNNMATDDDAQERTEDWANVTTEELLGTAVYGENDEWIGDLSELKLADSGEIDGVIIDVGGFLGLGEKPVAMSLDQVDIRRARGDELRAYVSATEEELESMPEWNDTY